MSQPQTISTVAAEAFSDTLQTNLAATLKAAGDPLRLEILRLLARDSFGVMELARIFDIKQSGMSHHLKVLAQASLVSTRREGNSIFYRRALPASDNSQRELLIKLFDTVDHLELAEPVQLRLLAIQQERTTASETFFADNASKFREQQDLIASYPIYAEAITELLSNTPLPGTQIAIEIGPGEGEFLQVLSPKFQRLVAIDTSRTMLDKAEQLSADASLANVEFINSDTSDKKLQILEADCAVLNMVLHHTPSPAAIIQQLSALLKTDGALLITELCHHDQQWAKEACGDLWLGFEPDDLTNWTSEAGFSEGQSQYMALRNGFQIQVRQFFKRANS
jgi:ArsR family transcriptional regulator